jgi:hypothetical protein
MWELSTMSPNRTSPTTKPITGRGVFLIAIMSSLAGWTATAKATEDDPALKEQFLREAPPKWEDYSQRAKQLQGTYSFRFSFSPSNVKTANTYVMKMNEKCKMLEIDIERKVPDNKKGDYRILELTAFNPKYLFTLKRLSVTDAWTVKNLVRVNSGQLSEKDLNDFATFEKDILDLIRIEGEFLVDMIGRSTFRMMRCRKLVEGGDELVEIEFESPRTPKEGERGPQYGRMVLDPHRYWCWKAYEVRTKSPSGTVGLSKMKVHELSQAQNGIPVARRLKGQSEYQSTDGTKSVREIDIECDLDVPARLPRDEEFSLSAFGLPEPLGVSWSRTPWYLWAALAGILFLLVGAGFYWLKRRREAAGS